MLRLSALGPRLHHQAPPARTGVPRASLKAESREPRALYLPTLTRSVTHCRAGVPFRVAGV